jgi:hypothetical protein
VLIKMALARELPHDFSVFVTPSVTLNQRSLASPSGLGF